VVKSAAALVVVVQLLSVIAVVVIFKAVDEVRRSPLQIK
jgi:hypothetical protein